ncbi:MAG TPA: hypothetical protein VHV83_10540, partial [Armatimonadota bacterium]|nr:hypothetical protein [Armatimonadota bacterium]
MTSMTRQRIRYSVILLTTISLMAFAVYAMAAGEKSQVLRGLTLHANGATVTVDPGECLINGKVVKVTKPTTLQIDPADTIDVKDEAVKLS